MRRPAQRRRRPTATARTGVAATLWARDGKSAISLCSPNSSPDGAAAFLANEAPADQGQRTRSDQAHLNAAKEPAFSPSFLLLHSDKNVTKWKLNLTFLNTVQYQQGANKGEAPESDNKKTGVGCVWRDRQIRGGATPPA